MIDKILNLFFKEKKVCMTIMRDTPDIYEKANISMENDRVKKYVEQTAKTCLSNYFIANKGLNLYERILSNR